MLSEGVNSTMSNTMTYGLTFDYIDGKSQIKSVTAPNGQVVTLTYVNGVINDKLITDQEAIILTEASEFFNRQWKARPRNIIREVKKGIRCNRK